MIIERIDIDGIKAITPEPFCDERGEFSSRKIPYIIFQFYSSRHRMYF